MTVKQLIRKLSKMPEDAQVVMYNHDLFIDGMYYVTGVKDASLGEKQVEIISDYEQIARGWGYD